MSLRFALLPLVAAVAFLFAACNGHDSVGERDLPTAVADDSGQDPDEPVTLLVPSDQELVIEVEHVLPIVGEKSDITVRLSSPEASQTARLLISTPDGKREVSQELGASSDGRWTYSWTPSTYGLYSISATSEGSQKKRALEDFFVAPPGYQVTRRTGVELDDLNGDGWAEELRAKVEIVVPEGGDYILSVVVADGAGFPASSAASVEAYFEAGAHELELVFDGSHIRENAASGPLQLVGAWLSLSAVGGFQPVAYAAVVDTDLGVEIADLQPPPPSIDFDSFADKGIDEDGDGVLEGIAFTGEFRAPIDGNYTVQVTLKDSRGRDVSLEMWSRTVKAGVHQFVVNFGAQEILYSGEDGPYHVTFVAVTLDTHGPRAYERETYVTASYTRADFSAKQTHETAASLDTPKSFLSGTSGHMTFIPIAIDSPIGINVEVMTGAEGGVLMLRDPSGSTLFVARPSKGLSFLRDLPLSDVGEYVFVYESGSASSESVTITARPVPPPVEIQVNTNEPVTVETTVPGQMLVIEFHTDEHSRYQLVLQSDAVLSGIMHLLHPSEGGRSMEFEDGRPRPAFFEFPTAGLARIVVVPDKAEAGVINFEIVSERQQ